MRKIIKITAVFCIIALLASCGLVSNVEEEKPRKKGEVVVTVDGKDYDVERFNIYFYSAQGETLVAEGYQQSGDVPEDFWSQEVDGKTRLEIAKEKALSTLIDDALAYKKVKEFGLELTEDEKKNIDSQIETMEKDEEAMKHFEAIGVSIDAIREYYNEGFLLSHISSELMERGDITVDEDAVLKEFKENYVKAKHILISTVDAESGAALSEDEVAAANAKAQDILNQLNSGADFDELMNANSEDPGLATAPDGYVFTKGEMVAEFEEAAYALKENQISGLVNTSYGIHILKRVPFDMEGAQETSALEAKKAELAVPEIEALLKTWKANAKIKTNDKVLDKLKAFDAKEIFGQ